MFGKQSRRFFADHPLATYGILYICVALSFAGAYWMMPGQFYHSTAMHKPMLKSDEELRSGLQEVLREQGRKDHGSEIFTHYGINYPIDNYTVYNVEYESGQFRVGTTIHGKHTSVVIPHIFGQVSG